MKVKKQKTQQKNDEKVKSDVTETPSKIVDNSIFKYFNDLTNELEGVRINAGTLLVQNLSKTQDEEKRKKEISYCLKRLVRGVGASTSASRAGFFTTLVAFLQTTTSSGVTIQDVIDAVQKELNVGTSISNKEDADAFVGKILVCSAVIRSGRLSETNAENLEQITNILIQASRHRTYHCSLAFSTLIEMMDKLTSEQFQQSVWPLLQTELIKPWPKQTLQIVHCLIAAHLKFPSVLEKKFLKMHFGGSKLLNSDSQPHLLRLFFGSTNSDILTHPALEAFGVYIATCPDLVDFVENHIDPHLNAPNKMQEIISLKVFADIFANLNNEKTPVSRLLTPNFVKMIVASLKNVKSKKDETFKAFYSEFFENLSTCCSKATDTERIGVIHKLILHPGTLSIEKFTKTRIIHQIIGYLGEDGVQNIFKTYKEIFLNRLPKNPDNNSETWLNFERQNAAFMLQHLLSLKSVQKLFVWRQEQLQFFMVIGLFNVNDSGEICKLSEAGQLLKDFGVYMKSIFYASLQSKLSALKDEKTVLLSLIEICNSYIQKKSAAKYFRQKLNDEITKAWNEMYSEVHNSKILHGSEKKIQLVFHILLLHMGLQLFKDPEMAGTAILDLEKCMAMARTKEKKKSSDGSEPEWIEVVVDLFLHLLSHTSTSLRNIVNAVFPHLCDSMSVTAVHQILAMLDMKDGQNPLSGKNDEDEEQEEEDEDEDKENISSSEDEEDKPNRNVSGDDEVEQNESSSEDEDDEELEDEEEATASDKLRNAVSLALGSAIAKDDDQDSIDLNDLTEEEGKKLDQALAAAFGAMTKSGGDSKNKKSKSHRIQMTTVMHFRIRVLDLLDIYIQHQPSLLITIEIMLVLFDMIEFCTDEELKPLQIRVEKLLNKLTALQSFGSVQDVTEDNFVSFIRLILDKKLRPIAYTVQNRLKNKCCMFLFTNAKLVSADGKNDKVVSLLAEYIEVFINTRNPLINASLIKNIFEMRWPTVWNLASILAEKGLSTSLRSLRRIQIFDLLSVVYLNKAFITQHLKTAKKHFKRIETIVCQYLEEISKTVIISENEFNKLLKFFITVNVCYKKLERPNKILSAYTEHIQEIRSRMKLESKTYKKIFCVHYDVKPIGNATAQARNESTKNRKTPKIVDQNDNGEDASESQKLEKKKRKTTDATGAESFKKAKKMKKEERMKAFSKGLNGGFNFENSSTQKAVAISDGLTNGDV